MKILHVIESLAPEKGGPPQVCANLCASQSADHNVTLATYSSEVESRKIVDFNKSVQLKRINHTISERLFGSCSRRDLVKDVQDAEMIHLHNVWESLLVSTGELATKTDTPYCISPHGMLAPWSLSQKPLKKRIALALKRRAMLESATFIHALNEAELLGFSKLGLKNRCEIIPNGVDLSVIDGALSRTWFKQRYPNLAEVPFVLFLGRLHYVKGLDILAKCASRFFAQAADWKWVIAGPDGGAQEEFESIINAQGCQNNVHVIGPVYGENKFSLLAAASAFCQPSRQEGFSISILEAMAARLPVCISENCHFPEVASEGCGVVTSLDVDAFTEGLLELTRCDQSRRQIGDNARQLVEARYTWENVSKQFIERMKT